MKILVIGSKGVMGRRYCAILRFLKEEVIEWDIDNDIKEILGWSFDRAIIACPTEHHLGWCVRMSDLRIPFLCEKPIEKESDKLSLLASICRRRNVDARMVCNWFFAINQAMYRNQKIAVMDEMHISYSYYDSGKDGFFWDCIQPIFMAGKFTYDRARPAFEAKVNGIEITLNDISDSYVMMISEWLYGDKGKLWSLEDALKATEKVERCLAAGLPEIAGEIDFKGVGT